MPDPRAGHTLEAGGPTLGLALGLTLGLTLAHAHALARTRSFARTHARMHDTSRTARDREPENSELDFPVGLTPPTSDLRFILKAENLAVGPCSCICAST